MHSLKNLMPTVRAILRVAGPTRVLDVGSGLGELVLALLSSNCDAQGVDISPVAVKQAELRAPGRFKIGSVLSLPFGDDEFPTVVSMNLLEHLNETDIARALKEMWRVCSDTLYLKVDTAQSESSPVCQVVRRRIWWEEQLVLAGFRKHPMQLDIIGYDEIETEGAAITLVMQKIPASIADKYSMDVLREERMLHMDMTRDPGRRSDAHIVRYKLARDFIRPGDTVLDIACGLGYGAAMMSYGSGASRIIGVDNSAFAIDYAKENFGDDPRLEFRCEDGADLDWLEDASIDYVVSMETLEHLPDPDAFVAEMARILKPSGRIFVSVPNMWVDEHGRDPNPHHLHVYDLAKLKRQLSAQFQLESAWEQTAGGAFKLPEGKRLLRPVDIHANEIPDPEWWLCLAIKSPLTEGAAKSYVETVHLTQKDSSSHVTDFATWYDNPYLVTGLVDRGRRVKDRAALNRMAQETVATSSRNSADRGAALCVLAYATLEAFDRFTGAAEEPADCFANTLQLFQQINDYLDVESQNPHCRRWQISLACVLGKLHSARGELLEAEAAFRRCVSFDPHEFSPLIATKTLEASLALADFELTRDDRDAALKTLIQAVERSKHIIGRDWPNVIGSAERPLTFGLLELADVCGLAARCALQAEALTRGWSKSFAYVRGQMTLQERFNALFHSCQDVQKQLAVLQNVGTQKDIQLQRNRNDPIQGLSKQSAIITKASSARRLLIKFYRLARADGLNAATAQTSQFLKSQLVRRMPYLCRIKYCLMPYLRRIKYFSSKFLEHTRERGLKSALDRSADEIVARVPYLRHRKAAKAAQEFANLMADTAEPRRAMRERDTGAPQFAMLVKDFCDGGLEKVVTDLTQQFQRHGISCPILVCGSAGRAAAHATNIGCNVCVFNGEIDRLAACVRDLGLKVIFTHHCYEGLEQLSGSGVKMVEVIHNAYHWQHEDPWIAELRSRYVNGYIAVSGFVRDYSVSHLSLAPKAIHLVENGLAREGLIRPRLPRLAKDRKDSVKSPILVHLANAHPQKNHIALLEAFEIVLKSHPSARLIFAGTLDDTTDVGRKLLDRVARNNLGANVECAGPLGRRELSRLLARAHVGLLPSMLEGFSIASLEYAYFGLPTVLSETGAAHRLADEYRHVVIAQNAALSDDKLTPKQIEQHCKTPNPAAVQSIAEAIMAILSDYDHYAENAMKAGLDWRSYSIETTAQNYLNIARELAQ